MNPEEYEHHVADVLRTEGWRTTVTRRSRDLGIDVLASRGERRLAVQAKMYGSSSTKVNAEQVMRLYGASAYADCSDSLLVTNGGLTREAELVADKLGIDVRYVEAQTHRPAAEVTGSARSFGAIWREHIEPLAGTELVRGNGKSMKIIDVDGSGVRRITTGGTNQNIAIDVFRWTIDELRPSTSAVRFLPVSAAGRFKAKDPTVSVERLTREWTSGASVVYVGKANELRARLRAYARFGAGEPVAHWGGRLIWQLADADELLVAWHVVSEQIGARELERLLLRRFAEVHNGRRPFANLTS